MDEGAPPDSSAVTGRRVVVRGRRWTVAGVTRSDSCAAVRLRADDRDHAQTLLTPFDRLKILDANRRPRIVRPRRWLHDLDRALLDLHPFGSLRAAALAPIRLLPYQLEPAIAVFRDGVSRILIADGVGLGKTIQAGLLLLELTKRHESCRALVLTPAGLRDQWLAELRARLALSPILADTAWLRSTAAERPAHVNPWSLPGIYVASHDLVKRPEVLRPLEELSWDAVVIDEAHAATAGTDRRAALHAIAARSRHVILLTATPHDGNPAEREGLHRIGGDDPIVVFARSRADIGAGLARKTMVLTVVPTAAERLMHDLLDRYSARVWAEAGRRGDDRARLVSIVLRKRALSSAASLCSSVERRLALLSHNPPEDPWQLQLPLTQANDEDPLDDDAPSAALSVPGLADAKRERHLLEAIADAARLAAVDERKARFLLRLLARLRVRGHEPAIVFTEYRDTLARLERRVVAAGHAVAVLHGGLTLTDRSRVQEAFNTRGGVLLATDAASEGLNLHHRCRIVIHYELPWNPSRLEQRAGRVDRLGQTRRVHELALVAAHTAERLVVAPLVARAVAATATRVGLLGALTESRVAEAVMSGTPEAALIPIAEAHQLPTCAVAAPEGLGVSAALEAARLEHHRRLAERSCHGTEYGAASRPIVTTVARSASLQPGLFLIFTLTLTRADGVRVHADTCVLRVDLAWPNTCPLRELVVALAHSPESLVTVRVDQVAKDALGSVTALERRRADRQAHRDTALEDAIARGQPSAARLLVQAGLFDRRALRAAAARAQSEAGRQEELKERATPVADGSPAEPGAELIAALLVTGRR